MGAKDPGAGDAELDEQFRTQSKYSKFKIHCNRSGILPERIRRKLLDAVIYRITKKLHGSCSFFVLLQDFSQNSV